MNPQFMKTLYEWSTKQQSGISSMEPMDLQRQKWLQEAMESMFVDGATIIRTCFTALPDLNCEEQIDVWENLQELLENIDNAMVLKPLGKWPDIIKAMKQDDTIHVYAQKAAASALQNCPDAIKAALDNNIVDAIKIEKSCLGVVSALIKDAQGVQLLEQNILQKFLGLGCDERVMYLNEQLAALAADEESPLEAKKAYTNQIIQQ
ncbi:Hsp70 nucleotide exchange factor Fes1 [Spironucleus salmonicida]|nr:Hsp70 nucleotide exchange factor Fes1 [Spironucleus salmonicida]|eukprot:EST49493.1 Hsp70 nucleotide exchange factor Fes1 [Spironucleus salmonicida]